MPSQNVVDLLSKIERRVVEFGTDKINLGRFMNDKDYRSGMLDTYSKSEDVELRELAQEAISLNIVKQIGLHDYASGDDSSFSAWIRDNFYYGLLGTIIVLIIGAAGFFAKDRYGTLARAVEIASIGPAKPTTKVSNEHAKHLPRVRPRIILRMHGSSTVGASLAPNLANAYLKSIGASETDWAKFDEPAKKYILGYLPKTEEAVAVEIFGYRSKFAFKAVAAGQAGIGMSSRPITTEEREQLRPLYGDLATGDSEIVIGLDGLTIIVNKVNPIESLTIPQLAGLFAGELTDWSDVGGRPGSVRIYAPDDDSGTYNVFERLVLEKNHKRLGVAARRYTSNAELSDNVAKDPNAVGFVGLSDVRRAKPIAVATSHIVTPLLPTSFTIASEDYPLTRRFYFYVVANPDNPHIQGMVDFTLSEAGQEIVKEAGFISQAIYAEKPSVRLGMPRDYLALTKNAKRLSVTFHFELGRSELVNKGKRDLTRLINYLEQHPGKHLMLFGFSDNIGSANKNLQLSQARAHNVENHLIPYGISPIVVKGFGEVLPIASDRTAFGRDKNRRVEVWVN